MGLQPMLHQYHLPEPNHIIRCLNLTSRCHSFVPKLNQSNMDLLPLDEMPMGLCLCVSVEMLKGRLSGSGRYAKGPIVCQGLTWLNMSSSDTKGYLLHLDVRPVSRQVIQYQGGLPCFLMGR